MNTQLYETRQNLVLFSCLFLESPSAIERYVRRRLELVTPCQRRMKSWARQQCESSCRQINLTFVNIAS